MMASFPDAAMEGNIVLVCEALGLTTDEDRILVERAITAKDGNVNAVVNDFLIDPEKFRQAYSEVPKRWDETLFNANRDGTDLPHFQIQAPDEPQVVQGVQPGATWNPAPSRPPSRTNNRTPIGAPTSQAQEEDDLARAIAESSAETVMPTPQESGVVATRGITFGPATRDTYDTEMALIKVNGELSDSPPSSRKRQPGVPVFLHCRKNDELKHLLGPLLMVFHEIPAARNTLLTSGKAAQYSYGHDKEWWKGARIPPPGPQGYEETEFSHELHRLMAFLDESDRSYGSADSLDAIRCSSAKYGWDEAVLAFFQMIRDDNDSRNELIRAIWTDVHLEPVATDGTSSEDSFGCLELRMPAEEPEIFSSLYSLCDQTYWAPDVEEAGSTQIACIRSPSEVTTIRVQDISRPFEIPEIFHIDRYLEANLQVSRELQAKASTALKAIAKAKQTDDVTKWKDPQTGKVWDRTIMYKKVIEKDQKRIWQQKASALWRKHTDLEGTDAAFPFLPDELIDLAAVELNEVEQKAVKHWEAHIEILKRKQADIEKELRRMEREKKACVAYLAKLGEALTRPDEDQERVYHPGYHLRGVVISPELVYMRRRALNTEGDSHMNGVSETADQWWKLSFVADQEEPVEAQRTTLEEAKRDFFAGCSAENLKKGVLIYATEKALDEPPMPLPDTLKTFARFDNRLFKQELLEEPSPREKKRSANPSPESPLKRHRGRSGSIDSMASNLSMASDRASLGNISDVGERMALLDREHELESGFQPDHQSYDNTFKFTTRPEVLSMADADLPTHTRTQDEVTRLPTPPSSPPSENDRSSPQLSRQSVRLANFSLNEGGEGGAAADVPRTVISTLEKDVPDAGSSQQQQQQQQQQPETRAPEMQERAAPFLVRRAGQGPVDHRMSILDRTMTIDGSLEMPGEGDPEDYYK